MRKLEGIYNKISIVVAKKILGLISHQEAKALQVWEQENASLNFDGKDFTSLFVQRNKRSYYQKENVREDWERIEKQISIRKTMYKIWIRRAAACAALVAVLFGITWLFRDTEKKQDVFVASLQHEIKPGKVQAVVTLENGEQVELQKNDKGNIGKYGKVVGEQGGKLVYAAATGVKGEIFNMISVPQGGEYQLELSDGTQVWLNAETKLVYPVRFVGGERKVILEGEAYFEVSEDKKHPFIISVGDLEVKVLGTSFNVHGYADEENIVTTLLTGSVQINKQQQVLGVLRPSEQGVWDVSRKHFEAAEVYAPAYVQWRDGDFNFRG